jgi:hypothetical protein
MSVVTNIILVTGIEGDDEEGMPSPGAAKLNLWIENEHQSCGPNALVKVDHIGGGNKAIESDMYIGAVNYLIKEDLVAVFRSIKWERPESAQLIIREQDEDKYSVYSADD